MQRNIDIRGLMTLQDKHGRVFPTGRVLFRQGEIGTEFYVILDGQVEMSTRGADGTDRVLVVLERGDFFGEMAVFRHEPRSATARLLTDSSLLYFSARTAADLLVRSPQFALGIVQTLCDRIASNNEAILSLSTAFEVLQAEHETTTAALTELQAKYARASARADQALLNTGPRLNQLPAMDQSLLDALKEEPRSGGGTARVDPSQNADMSNKIRPPGSGLRW